MRPLHEGPFSFLFLWKRGEEPVFPRRRSRFGERICGFFAQTAKGGRAFSRRLPPRKHAQGAAAYRRKARDFKGWGNAQGMGAMPGREHPGRQHGRAVFGGAGDTRLFVPWSLPQPECAARPASVRKRGPGKRVIFSFAVTPLSPVPGKKGSCFRKAPLSTLPANTL